MAVDSNVNVYLDGDFLEQFSFKNGKTIEATVSEGAHQLKTEIALGPIKRTKEFSFRCQRGKRSELTLDYSRIWGNFTDLKFKEI